MSEAVVLKACLLEASRRGWRLFRNQVGQYLLADGRRISSGLTKGSSDLIGWRTVTITPDMVGQRIAQFVAVECKSENGVLSPEQENFLRVVREHGGHAVVAKRPADL